MLSSTLSDKVCKLAFASLELPTGRNRHFTFVVKRNTVVCYGYNQAFKSHPLSAKFGHRFNDIHSELSAILNFPLPVKLLRDYTFINIRVRRIDGKLGLAAPCKYCEQLLSSF